MQISPSVRYSVLAALVALLLGLFWSGLNRYMAEGRAAAATSGGGPTQALSAETVLPGSDVTALRDPTESSGADRSGQALPAPEQAEPPLLVVHVAGAVARPGVYRFPPGSRVADAVAAAGEAVEGGVPDALNLAELLADGAKIYVYTRAELESATPPAAAKGSAYEPVTASAGGGAGSPSGAGGGARSGRVNINTASARELESVSGIGKVTAQAIIDHRTRHGPFQRLEDLISVKGIGPATLEKLRPYLSV